MNTMKSRSRRHVFATVTVGVAVSLAPMLPVGGVAFADAPAVVLTGLSRGAQGDAVKEVQQALIRNGVSVAGGADGVFGAGTEAALKQFQTWHGLSATGSVDAATALALGLATSPYLDLAPGDRGDNVRKLQQRLIDIGIAVSGGVDGIYGQGTARAVKEFQSSANFSPTGSVNAATAAALEAAATAPGAAAPADESAPEAAEQPTASDATDNATDDEAVARPEAAVHDGLVGLKIGSRGDAVVTLQRTIMAAGFTVVGGADGVFGALTANALKSFQTANGLDATGVVDQGTANALAIVGLRVDDGHDHDHGGGDDHSPGVTNPYLGLQYGSLGADVKALQQLLLDIGIQVRGGADGVFGFATRDAVKEFQGRHNLEQTGKVDEATANALASGAAAGGNSSLVGLKAGALGNTVKQLQQALIDAGITVRGGADGIFGPATTNALKEFQTSQGLEATGVVDAATAEALANPKSVTPPSDDGGAELGYAEYGERGARVIALQTALVEAGITLRGGVDGDFGGGTSAAVMDFQTREGLNVTGKVNQATAEALGLDAMPAPVEVDASSVELKVFPVQGKCYYGDSWGYPRSGGRVHLGVDILAPEGNLLYAVADGTITKVYADQPGALAGNGVRLTMADGTYFFYAHMLGLADGIAVGTKVQAGQILGQLGNTGNSGTPHLHFEVHPQGGSAVNPYPLVKAIDACDVTEVPPQP